MNDAVIDVIQSALHVIDVVYIVVRVRAACVSAASKCVDSRSVCGHIQHTVPFVCGHYGHVDLGICRSIVA